MSHHRIALIVIASAVVSAALLGWLASMAQPRFPLWHAEFCATANAVTDGCDIPPRGWGYLTTWLEYLLVVPLFAATFSFFTSGLAAGHVKQGVSRVLRGQQQMQEDIKEHVTETVSNG